MQDRTFCGFCREMLMQWTSLDFRDPQAQWGIHSKQHIYTAPSNVTKYTQGEMCGPPANASGWSDPGVLHRALLTGLKPSTRYFYRVGDPVSTVEILHLFNRWENVAQYLLRLL